MGTVSSSRLTPHDFPLTVHFLSFLNDLGECDSCFEGELGESERRSLPTVESEDEREWRVDASCCARTSSRLTLFWGLVCEGVDSGSMSSTNLEGMVRIDSRATSSDECVVKAEDCV
jgi:hypothetical protein